MSVNPGFGGQKFIPSMIPKLRRAKKMVRALSPDVLIEVDGGVGIDNIEMIAEAGADIFVAGSSVFTSGNYEKAIREMKAKANSSGISSGKVFRN